MRTVNIYQFNELSEEAKEKAIEDFKEESTDLLYDHDPIIEGMVEDLEEMGIENVRVQYSGFWSQGDGLSFTGAVTDTALFMSKMSLNLSSEPGIEFLRTSNHYNHEKTVRTQLELDEASFDEYDAVLEHIEEWRIVKCKEFYSRLEKYYYECTSDEAVTEYLNDDDNECWFSVTGKKINILQFEKLENELNG
jgi:hypothetical protein